MSSPQQKLLEQSAALNSEASRAFLSLYRRQRDMLRVGRRKSSAKQNCSVTHQNSTQNASIDYEPRSNQRSPDQLQDINNLMFAQRYFDPYSEVVNIQAFTNEDQFLYLHPHRSTEPLSTNFQSQMNQTNHQKSQYNSTKAKRQPQEQVQSSVRREQSVHCGESSPANTISATQNTQKMRNSHKKLSIQRASVPVNNLYQQESSILVKNQYYLQETTIGDYSQQSTKSKLAQGKAEQKQQRHITEIEQESEEAYSKVQVARRRGEARAEDSESAHSRSLFFLYSPVQSRKHSLLQNSLLNSSHNAPDSSGSDRKQKKEKVKRSRKKQSLKLPSLSLAQASTFKEDNTLLIQHFNDTPTQRSRRGVVQKQQSPSLVEDLLQRSAQRSASPARVAPDKLASQKYHTPERGEDTALLISASPRREEIRPRREGNRQLQLVARIRKQLHHLPQMQKSFQPNKSPQSISRQYRAQRFLIENSRNIYAAAESPAPNSVVKNSIILKHQKPGGDATVPPDRQLPESTKLEIFSKYRHLINGNRLEGELQQKTPEYLQLLQHQSIENEPQQTQLCQLMQSQNELYYQEFDKKMKRQSQHLSKYLASCNNLYAQQKTNDRARQSFVVQFKKHLQEVCEAKHNELCVLKQEYNHLRHFWLTDALVMARI